MTKIRNYIAYFLSNSKDYPIAYAIAVSSYPILFYYSNNYTLVNTWEHVVQFLLIYTLTSIILFGLVFLYIKPHEYRQKVFTFLVLFLFLFLLHTCLFSDIKILISIVLFIFSFFLSFFLYKHIKKIVVFQLILGFIGFFAVSNTIIKNHSISKEWMQQPDNIAEVLFKKKPNVYYIQPDGYINFSELKKGYYNMENNNFEAFLDSNDFKNYNDFRSNYVTTLSSNASSLMMKHHYYNNDVNYNEALNDRNIIISDNVVLNVFKNNGYKNYFIAEREYLIVNKPKMGFDYCNINYDDIPLLTGMLDETHDIITPLKNRINEKVNKPKFFFIRIRSPSHTKGKLSTEEERNIWFEKLERSNLVLTETINLIKKSDPNALILIMADHGGYVGLDHAVEFLKKTNDRNKIYSIFSSLLSIHWPNGNSPNFDKCLKSSINLFRVVFSYLSEDESYLSHLQADFSFAVFNTGSSSGVYKCINDKGEITFDKVSD